jgi:hypothetical protein
MMVDFFGYFDFHHGESPWLDGDGSAYCDLSRPMTWALARQRPVAWKIYAEITGSARYALWGAVSSCQ